MMASSANPLDVASISAGLLILRLALGVPMMAHATQKLFGWFGGYGLAGTAGYFETLGFRPGRLYVVLASLAELGCGFLVALGLLGPVGPALMVAPMLVAGLTVHRANGFFAGKNGIEVPFLYATGAIALGFTGFGVFSLDALLELTGLASPTLAALLVGVSALGALAMLALRRPVTRPAEARG